ncbi:hypothetical protein FGKAn22_02540 [Ferrigenium kumadai]|uniref:Uncharacterized protein n=1 Tax=Ferrigenium kumadai TaxID=1682490 RepID=A0AAN1SXU3_9PROT|nr:hypothetical protein [Ferrigenium kumadai]BBI98561.1 hypothetical protein FGKAn22_02540 [Ferrigenium kumadai]
MWNIVVSTVVFFVAVWYFRRLLDEQGIPKGMTRSLLVLVLASMVSLGSGAVVDWLQGPQPKAGASQDMSQLLKQVDGERPQN